MSKPNTKGNFLQTFLIITTLYLGFLMFMNGNKSSADTLTAEQVFAQLQKENRALLDVSIVGTDTAYNRKLDEQVKAKTIDEKTAESRKMAASVLVADAQLKAGLIRHDLSRMRLAYNTFHGLKGKHENEPIWTQSFEVPVGAPSDVTSNELAKAFGPRWATTGSTTSWTPKDLFEKTYAELLERNQKELVYGALPGFQIIDFLVGITGHNPAFSYAFACFLLALIVRALIFPLAQKQLMFSRQMSQLAPLSNEIRAKYKDDPQQQQVKVMELYKEYGINPLAGCWPAFAQMPLFLTVYQFMLAYQFAFQKGVFLWITPSVAKMTGNWTAPNLGEQDYPLIVLYAVTMLISVLMAPISDPTQAKQQRLMSIGISVMFSVFMFFWPLPSAFVLYWTFTNLLSMAQSYRAYRLPMPPLQKVNAAGGGVYPKSAIGGKWMKMMEDMQKQAAEQASQKGGNPPKPGNGQIISNGEVKTGSPAKHKPKKRK
ncbi:MAG TPA: YidC/Oxa1 family membrane protein insertase [Fimbriimonas sp.]|nr:YidC/Oxa1 family membrane protein insertase [Fimbriimonas sp.]